MRTWEGLVVVSLAGWKSQQVSNLEQTQACHPHLDQDTGCVLHPQSSFVRLALALAVTELASSSTVSPFLDFHACTRKGSAATWALEQRPTEDGPQRPKQGFPLEQPAGG